MRSLRALSARRRSSTRRDVTVLVVNWNTLEHLAVCLYGIRRFSPPSTKILVIDNGSTDRSRSYLRQRRDIRLMKLPVNVGHGHALDLGALRVRTEFIVTIDADAFPIDHGWLDLLIDPLDRGSYVSGVHVVRSYAHPCALAIRRERFITDGHTFQSRFLPDWRDTGLGGTSWDCGEAISLREAPHVTLFEPSGQFGPGWVGTWWSGIVYHNFYAGRSKLGEENIAHDGVALADPPRVWDEAVKRFLGLDAEARARLVLTQ